MQFPEYRGRRRRQNPSLRRLVRETQVMPNDLLFPLFVQEGKAPSEPIAAMPGQYRYSIEGLAKIVDEIADLGLPGLLLFGIPAQKDPLAKDAVLPRGLIPRAVAAIKDRHPELLVVTDVCVCAYTDHGHCGVLNGGDVDNDATLELLAEVALVHAKAGADLVAPSDMMDGRVGYIRETLDEENLESTGIMAYSAKYASAFYGPFRAAAQCSPKQGDRRSYQMDPANIREAITEVGMDVNEGADIVMIKPALAYLDVISRVREEFELPVAAYNVSGEYAMIKAADQQGWIDGQAVMLETLTAIKRAGADIVITYHALEAARLLG